MSRWRFVRDGCLCCWQAEVGGPYAIAAGHCRALIADPRLGRHDRLVPRDHCSVCKLPAEARLAPLTVEAATYWDAQQVARDAFHTTALRAEETADRAEAVVEWHGNSFNSRSGAPGRTREVRWRKARGA